ncbi:MAG: hypothetical protein ABW189_00950 [Rickettsiales bacterium]
MSVESLRYDLAKLTQECEAAKERREPIKQDVENFAAAVANAVGDLSASDRHIVADDVEAAISALNNYLSVMEKERDATGETVNRGQSRAAVFSAYAHMQRIGGYGGSR